MYSLFRSFRPVGLPPPPNACPPSPVSLPPLFAASFRQTCRTCKPASRSRCYVYGVFRLRVPRSRSFTPEPNPCTVDIVSAANRRGKPRVQAADQHGLESGTGLGRKGRRHHRAGGAEVSSGVVGLGKIGGGRQVRVPSHTRWTLSRWQWWLDALVVVTRARFYAKSCPGCGCWNRCRTCIFPRVGHIRSPFMMTVFRGRCIPDLLFLRGFRSCLPSVAWDLTQMFVRAECVPRSSCTAYRNDKWRI